MDVCGVFCVKNIRNFDKVEYGFWEREVFSYPLIEKWGDGELAVARQFLKAYFFCKDISLCQHEKMGCMYWTAAVCFYHSLIKAGGTFWQKVFKAG